MLTVTSRAAPSGMFSMKLLASISPSKPSKTLRALVKVGLISLSDRRFLNVAGRHFNCGVFVAPNCLGSQAADLDGNNLVEVTANGGQIEVRSKNNGLGAVEDIRALKQPSEVLFERL